MGGKIKPEARPMIHATLIRTNMTKEFTFGKLYIIDELICHTLEPPWKGNEKDVSCIPAGTYQVKRKFSKKYGWIWELQNVKDRTVVYIHRGNIVANTLGCILVGMEKGELNGVPAVLNSRGAWLKINQLFGDDEFELTITEA